ncbi:MAG TPA: cytochrome P450 [Pseudonocardiaceae bacterium]|nr:cytochrome P450 [Pseudonocardiaceae bacterium]
MTPGTMLEQITDFANRADPYPLYAELRKTPVAPQDDGSYLVSTYREILALLHDPRISSDLRNRTRYDPDSPDAAQPPTLIKLDPPEHDTLRRQAMRPFGPPHSPGRIEGMHAELAEISSGLIDGLMGRGRLDIVDDFAYPFPVTVICRVLGVPREDEPRFHVWAEALVEAIDPSPGEDPGERQRRSRRARVEIAQYMAGLIEQRRRSPRDDTLSGLVHDDGPDGPMAPVDMIINSVLLLVAGHETTVNLITNGMLTLLRHPDVLERLRREPGLMPRAVEELLRYEPPIQLLPQRTPLSEIEIGGVTIPEGAPLTLVLASGSRDPSRFRDPDRFDPARQDNEHFGFGSGVHSCFGAPLARLEVQLALNQLIHRLELPRLVEDPPPYRRNPVLRGPRHLLVECAGVRAESRTQR